MGGWAALLRLGLRVLLYGGEGGEALDQLTVDQLMRAQVAPPPHLVVVEVGHAAPESAHLRNMGNTFSGRFTQIFEPDPVLVDVNGAQESIPPGWESIPGLLKRFTNKYGLRNRSCSRFFSFESEYRKFV